jgi:starch phosphorylase
VRDARVSYGESVVVEGVNIDVAPGQIVCLMGRNGAGKTTLLKSLMGILALRNSDGRNAVSELHGHVARKMWHFLWKDQEEREVPITHITNGVHVSNWMARRLMNLFCDYLGEDWYDHLDENDFWSNIDGIPDADLWAVRLHLKRKLAFYMRERVRDRWTLGGFHPVQVVSSGVLINPYALTIGFARRFATYKRPSGADRCREIAAYHQPPQYAVQIIFAGKRPADEPAAVDPAGLSRSACEAGAACLSRRHDMNLARYLVQGVDVWMNTPRRPLEASGTSGMKAALNGALNFSVLDGWWREAYNGHNGWAIGEDKELESQSVQDAQDAQSIYTTLENEIIPLYYDRDQKEISHEWVARIKNSLKTNIPQFSTRRMLKEYVKRLYIKALPLPATAGKQ